MPIGVHIEVDTCKTVHTRHRGRPREGGNLPLRVSGVSEPARVRHDGFVPHGGEGRGRTAWRRRELRGTRSRGRALRSPRRGGRRPRWRPCVKGLFAGGRASSGGPEGEAGSRPSAVTSRPAPPPATTQRNASPKLGYAFRLHLDCRHDGQRPRQRRAVAQWPPCSRWPR